MRNNPLFRHYILFFKNKAVSLYLGKSYTVSSL